MNLNKLIKLALVASIFPVSAYAQESTAPGTTYTTPVQGMTVSDPNAPTAQATPAPGAYIAPAAPTAQPAVPQNTTAATPAPRQNLQLPKSMQNKQAATTTQAPASDDDISNWVNSAPEKAAAPAPAPLVEQSPVPAANPVFTKTTTTETTTVTTPAAKNPQQLKAEDMFKTQFDNTASNGQTMEKLLSDAYEKNPGINAARDALRAADESVFQARSGYLPKVDATYGKSQQDLKFTGTNSRTYYPYSESLNVTQGIFGSGETYYAVKAAEKRVLAARNELKNTEQQFMLDAINAYINYIFTQKVQELAINNEHVLNEQLTASHQRFEVGDATKTDVAQSEARLANARSSRVLAEGDFVNARANFKKILLVDAADKLPMPSNLPDIPATFDDAMNLAMNNNPQVQQLKYLIEGADADINARRSQLLPQVDANGSISKSENPSVFGNVLTEGQTVGVQVTVPIYNAGIDYSRMREAHDRRSQARQQYNDVVNTVKSSVAQAWQRIATSAANIEATKSSLTASDFALEGVREEQKEGARTTLDVLDAEQERFIAETSHARAIKDSVISIYNLKAVLGDLTPSQLGLTIKDYDPEEHYKNTRFKLLGL